MFDASGQGTGHAEEGLPRAGGAVRSREGAVQVVRGVQSGDTQTGVARHSEESFLSFKEGEIMRKYVKEGCFCVT